MTGVSATRTDLAGLVGQIVRLAGPINALMARTYVAAQRFSGIASPGGTAAGEAS